MCSEGMEMKIRWIGQSGYVIKTPQTEIIIDPYLSDVVNRVTGKSRMVVAPIKPQDVLADAVVCTHHHLDHLDPDAIQEMDKSLLFITTEEGAAFLRSIGCKRVTVFHAGDTLQVGDINLIGVVACHTVEAFGLIVKTEGLTLYFSGDTLYDSRLFEISAFTPDYTFICINGKLGNMNVEEAVETALHIGARINVPNHYGMFESNSEDPTRFTEKMSNGFIMEFDHEYVIEKNRQLGEG